MDLNKVMIIGRLTRDPELRSTPSGVNVCSMSVATNFVILNKETGQKTDNVEYHNIVLWRKLADIANQYLKKGKQVYIEGRLQTRSWEGKEGDKKFKTEIVADEMIMLGDNRDSGAGAVVNPAPQGAVPQPAQPQGEQEISVEGVPF